MLKISPFLFHFFIQQDGDYYGSFLISLSLYSEETRFPGCLPLTEGKWIYFR